MLALRDDDGQWARGAYFPAIGASSESADPDSASHEGDHPDVERSASVGGDDSGGDTGWDRGPQPLTATTYSLLLLRDFGIDPRSEPMRQTIALVRDNCRWEEGGQPYFDGEVEPCINGMTVALGAYFDQDVDGSSPGCRRATGRRRLELLGGVRRRGVLGRHDDQRARGPAGPRTGHGRLAQSVDARRRGEEYLLERGLFRRKSTGAVIDPAWLTFSFPTRWHYDVLRALEYFRSTGEPPDPRVAEAVEVLRSKEQPDGTWLLETPSRDRPFPVDDGDGRSSRWNTLRALRVLTGTGPGGK